jgi:hypothetical protein
VNCDQYFLLKNHLKASQNKLIAWWFVLREEYCWLVAGGWFVLREKYCWLVANKPSELEDAINRPAAFWLMTFPFQLFIGAKPWMVQCRDDTSARRHVPSGRPPRGRGEGKLIPDQWESDTCSCSGVIKNNFINNVTGLESLKNAVTKLLLVPPFHFISFHLSLSSFVWGDDPRLQREKKIDPHKKKSNHYHSLTIHNFWSWHFTRITSWLLVVDRITFTCMGSTSR